MQDKSTLPPQDVAQKMHPKRINELNFELIQAERGEIKLTLDKIVSYVMDIVYFKAFQESERPIVDLEIARVYKRGFLAAEKSGFNVMQNTAVIGFLLQGFQNHIDRYIKSQQKNVGEGVNVF